MEIDRALNLNLDMDQSCNDAAKMASHRVGENTQLPEGVNLDESDLDEDQKEVANNMFTKWSNMFSKGTLDIPK